MMTENNTRQCKINTRFHAQYLKYYLLVYESCNKQDPSVEDEIRLTT